MKSVAYLISTFPAPSETFIADEAASLFNYGRKPYVIYLKTGDKEVIPPAARILIDRGGLLKLDVWAKSKVFCSLLYMLAAKPQKTLRTLAKALRSDKRWLYFQSLPVAEYCLKKKIVFLHAHFADVNFMYAAKISEWTGIPFGVTTHGYDLREDPVGKDVAGNLFQRANAVITICDFNRRMMMEKYALPASKIHVVHCGIDLRRFNVAKRTTRRKSQRLNILNVGRLESAKAQDVLLQALSIAKEKGIEFRLEIIGGGSLKETLAAQADSFGISDSVKFHGAKTGEFVIERFAAADLFVLSSRLEGLPVVLMEAMAVGTPVISTNISGIPELISRT